ncbi:ATP-dependent zinc protease [Qipengyuania flava]|nr:ATP-dependent zinc protease [Qipengyuania flava]
MSMSQLQFSLLMLPLLAAGLVACGDGSQIGHETEGEAEESGEPLDIDGDGAIVKPSSYLTVVGRVENVRLGPNGPQLKAKIDTGALSSSIDAQNIERFERDGDEWVRFDTKSNGGEALSFERPVVDTVRIKSASSEGQERPVVEMPLCIAGIVQTVRVTLADRTGLNYRFLVGRQALEKGNLLVNVKQAFSAEPRCDREA